MKNDKKAYRAALYLRLSKDDGAGESASIGTQRSMLRAYAAEHGFDIYDEYVDDGWSGTNFERPNWRRMIADIEGKRVNLVLTKDLSRLGRDYITAGQYTELYFPSKGVRYIAINDGYDSDSPYTDIAPFKNVFNEMYARDTSKKIRSAFQTKMRGGAYIGNFAPYGYRKDPEDKNHLLVDAVAAPVVVELFRMAEKGHAPAEIAKCMNEKGVATPAVYRCVQHPYLDVNRYTKRKEWTSAIVCKMLRNETYLGRVVQGKTTKISFKSDVTLQNPREEWIVAEHMHEPLVTQETFLRVRDRCVSRRNPPKTGFTNLFSGIAKCGDCGRNMSTTASRRKGSTYNLVCGGYKLSGSRGCTNHFMDYELLCRTVLRDLQSLLALTQEDRLEMLGALKTTAQAADGVDADAGKAVEKREMELDRIVARLYEDNAAGRLDDARFYKILAGYEAEQNALTARRCDPGRPLAQRPEPCYSFSAPLEELSELQVLTWELLHTLVDKIEIFQGSFADGEKRQSIRIYYQWNNGAQPPTVA